MYPFDISVWLYNNHLENNLANANDFYTKLINKYKIIYNNIKFI